MTTPPTIPALPVTRRALTREAVVASYQSNADAEEAVRRLAGSGLPVETISIIGRSFETHEGIRGFYPADDTVREGAQKGALFGGVFGLMRGRMGFFVLPVVGALTIFGPLAGLVAEAIGCAGVGAFINGLIALGIPRDQALKYQERLQTGEFLVVVNGDVGETAQAREILHDTHQTHLATHATKPEAPFTILPSASQCENCKRRGLNIGNPACHGRKLAQPMAETNA